MTVPAAPDPFTALCADIDRIIAYASTHQPRSLQQQLGPSDIGSPCDRRLGFHLARVAPCNFPSKWEAYIGTAVHIKLAHDFSRILLPDGSPRFLVEQKLDIGHIAPDVLEGTSDLYDRLTGFVLDWKIVGKTPLAHYRRHGPGPRFRVQDHTYGLGWRRRGYPVRGVAIAFLPRSERYDRRVFWHEPYDEAISVHAIQRVNGISAVVHQSGPTILPHLRPVADDCFFCPWFRPGSRDLTRACPGDLDLPRPAHTLADLHPAPKELA
ncbi:hypothetical protein [Nonomuraea ceibae]|uniref:hypothetical protein n=1 Tax=Nonomuraea ceibae TaxID=1935170 RepID=UPI001C5D369E|nr:hypothetical protein [Nonomuraea ceibae]